MFDHFIWVLGAVICGAAAVSFLRGIALGRASRQWPVVPGRIVASGVNVIRRAAYSEGLPHVRYTYVVDGITYEAKQLVFGGDRLDNSTEGGAAKRLERYAHDAVVEVHYDPRRPARAVLEPGFVPADVVSALAFAAGCAVCVYLLISG